jgi:predicted ATPase
LSELSRILPELRERYPHFPGAAGDETTARIRLFEAVTRLVQAVGERSPVILFLDDVHWADAASLICQKGKPWWRSTRF